MEKFRKGLFFHPDGGGSAGGEGDPNEGGSDDGQQQNDGNGDGNVLRWDTWHGDQPEEIQTLISEHESSLKTALDSERDARKKAEKSLREMADKMDDANEMKAELLELANNSEKVSQKADFYEDAHAAGVTNLKLAYLAAQQDDLFDRKGNVDFDQMKIDYPQLFVRKNIPDGGAGQGTGSQMKSGGKDMNSFIRTAAGRK